MQYLTPEQYRKFKKISRQNFWQKVDRGTIPTVKRDVKVNKVMVPVEDIELEGVNLDTLTV